MTRRVYETDLEDVGCQLTLVWDLINLVLQRCEDFPEDYDKEKTALFMFGFKSYISVLLAASGNIRKIQEEIECTLEMENKKDEQITDI